MLARAVLAIGFMACLAPARLGAQSIGIYFDSLGTNCVSSIEPFGPCKSVFVIADAPSSGDLAGSLFVVQFPPDIRVCGGDPDGIEFVGRDTPTVRGSLASGLDLQYFPCVPQGRVILAKFRIFDAGFVRRQDLRLNLAGAPQDTISMYLKPLLKLCDPEDPEGNLGLLEATPLGAIMNCVEPCTCTTAVVQRTWAHVKTLFRGR